MNKPMFLTSDGKATAEYTIKAGDSFVDSALIKSDDDNTKGLDAFCAQINTTGITVTPTIYYYYGDKIGFGESHTLKSNADTPAYTFTSTAKFECIVQKQSHRTPCEGYKIRFTLSVVTVGAKLIACASVR